MATPTGPTRAAGPNGSPGRHPRPASAPGRRGRGRLEAWLSRLWWRPRRGLAGWLLTPLAWLYGALARIRRTGASGQWHAPCPVLVVGNLVVGGAGKTPTVIALVHALRAAGWHPGVVSRGYGRHGSGRSEVDAAATAFDVGDEPWLIHRRTLAPLVVAESRSAAARLLLRNHPEVDLLIADDGLQHHALARDAEVWVFDERGIGNGALLPAGPLRQPLPATVPVQALVLYNAPRPSTALPGAVATRRLAGAVLLDEWQRGAAMQPAALRALAGRPVPAVAGIAAPGRFFGMLRDAGVTVEPLPLPDHAAFDAVPWRPGTPEVVCTEKDAAKLVLLPPGALGTTRVWVVGLDFRLPQDFLAAVQRRLRAAPRQRGAIDDPPPVTTDTRRP